MVWVLSLSDMDLSTHALTAGKHYIAFGVCQISYIEVELLIGCGGFTAYQFLTNSECYIMFTSSEGMGAKVHVREGKNPDHQLRSPNVC